VNGSPPEPRCRRAESSSSRRAARRRGRSEITVSTAPGHATRLETEHRLRREL
jgi:hypothetical protein